MRANLGLIFIILTIFLLENSGAEDKKLNVQIFYEALCSDSQTFIQQLGRSYEQLKNKISIDFIPFGKARHINYGNKVSFTCQHGPAECAGNKYQSCVLNLIPNQDLQVRYVTCAMSYNPDLDYCARIVKVDMSEVEKCWNGDLGTQLQLKAEADTSPIISLSRFVPTIVFNEKYDLTKQWRAITDFQGTVENILTEQSR